MRGEYVSGPIVDISDRHASFRSLTEQTEQEKRPFVSCCRLLLLFSQPKMLPRQSNFQPSDTDPPPPVQPIPSLGPCPTTEFMFVSPQSIAHTRIGSLQPNLPVGPRSKTRRGPFAPGIRPMRASSARLCTVTDGRFYHGPRSVSGCPGRRYG